MLYKTVMLFVNQRCTCIQK